MCEFIVTNSPSNAYSLTNQVYLSCTEYPDAQYVKIKDYVYSIGRHTGIENKSIGLSLIQRQDLRASVNMPIKVNRYTPLPGKIPVAVSIAISVSTGKNGNFLDPLKSISHGDIAVVVSRVFDGQFLQVNQNFMIEVGGIKLRCNLKNMNVYWENSETRLVSESTMGKIEKSTAILIIDECQQGGSCQLIKKNNSNSSSDIQFNPDWNFQSMGIGGLSAEFNNIFRRAFASRLFPSQFLNEIGIEHVKGILLYGPPGTGKTLMARQIGKMLNGKEPKIVNGPEILNKYVGESERNIRALFEEAEKDLDKNECGLHIIIFDEIDAICKQRGSSGSSSSAVHDTVVNQLLSKIDGVKSLPNVLLIGMTNRKDLIDEALLRPGRLEVQVEIGLPDEDGRLEILHIHTKRMDQSEHLSPDVNLKSIAENTRNFTGAELEGLVKGAASFAFNRLIDVDDVHKKVDTSKVTISMSDFIKSMDDITPMFGRNMGNTSEKYPYGIMSIDDTIEKNFNIINTIADQLKRSEKGNVLNIMIQSGPGCGKTAFSAFVCNQVNFPFCRFITPELFIGMNEQQKCEKIKTVFDQAHKSSLGMIVIDDLEQIIDYVDIGPRFSNSVLQTLKICLKKTPNSGRRLMVICTSSAIGSIWNHLNISGVFDVNIKLGYVSSRTGFETVIGGVTELSKEQVEIIVDFLYENQKDVNIPVKKLIKISETINEYIEKEQFSEDCLLKCIKYYT